MTLFGLHRMVPIDPSLGRVSVDRIKFLHTFVPPKGLLVLWRDQGGTGNEKL